MTAYRRWKCAEMACDVVCWVLLIPTYPLIIVSTWVMDASEACRIRAHRARFPQFYPDN
jgi:hypothetical protein